MNKKFTHDWFSGNIAVWSVLLDKLKGKENLNFLEIGSYEGRATSWLLDNILTHPSSKIACIDTFEGGYEHKELNVDFTNVLEVFKNNILYKKEQVNILQGKSFDQLLHLQQKQLEYDFIYVDGSHEAKHVLQDAILSFELLKVGGIMIFDDYLWGDFTNNPSMTPKIAIECFAKSYEKQIDILHAQYQVAILKK